MCDSEIDAEDSYIIGLIHFLNNNEKVDKDLKSESEKLDNIARSI